jgi:hypothetical protein
MSRYATRPTTNCSHVVLFPLVDIDDDLDRVDIDDDGEATNDDDDDLDVYDDPPIIVRRVSSTSSSLDRALDVALRGLSSSRRRG